MRIVRLGAVMRGGGSRISRAALASGHAMNLLKSLLSSFGRPWRGLRTTAAVAMLGTAAAGGQLASPAAPTMQALFDAASAAVEAGRCADAVRDFTAIEARPGRRSPTVTAVIALRKGRCLAALDRPDDADAALTAGLASIGDAPTYVNDREQALLARGKIAYYRFDYPAATRDFAAARALAAPADRFEALLWLARSTMFDADAGALAYADEALALAATAQLKPAALAEVRTLHARVLLNHGDVRGGYAELKKALDEEGGLTFKVNAAMIATRSDLAVAALLNHDDDSAKKYLAYTGAGHGTPFGTAADMDPPPCDGADLRPDDSAIVEFGIRADGAVMYATPVYASRLGPTAVAFARAVADWSWTPDALAKIAPLFRAVTRVELRCSTASAAPDVLALLGRDLDQWLASRGAAPLAGEAGAAASIAPLRAELARRRAAGGDGVALIPLLRALATNGVVPHDQRRAAAVEAQEIAARAGAPVAAQTFLAATADLAAADDYGRTSYPARIAALRDRLATPAVAADPASRGVLRLIIAQPRYHVAPPADAATLLRAVANDLALAERDPLRSAARVRLASLLARSGDLPAARAAFIASGVDAAQCALVDARPVLTSAGVSSDDFPDEARRWGFDGWVRLEFDVAADGHIGGQRAIIAYPPQVFGPAAVKASRNWRYQQSFRPDGIAGCGGAQQQIRFRIAS